MFCSHPVRVAPPTVLFSRLRGSFGRRALPWLCCGMWILAAVPAAGALRSGNRAPGLDDPALRPGQEALPGVLLVKFRRSLEISAPGKSSGSPVVDELLAEQGVQRLEPVLSSRARARKPGKTDLSRVWRLHYTGSRDPRQVARDFATSTEVEYAEPEFLYPLAATPNDPLYASEQSVYFAKMALPTAFDSIQCGQGDVVIALVDGGTEWTHPDLQANLWNNPGETLNGIDDDGNGFIDDIRGWNFANGTNDPTGLPQTPGSAGHGTHVAGIACAVTDNGTGVAGASWNARFMPVCVAHPSVDNAIAYGYRGILYAVDAGADIINCSWGGPGNPSYFEREVIEYAHEQGAVLVAAAGNNGSDIPFYPAAYPRVLAVANLANNDQKILSSNFGTWVDVSAQGTNIHSTYLNGTYADLNGTSMASPHVAAVCALVKSKWPAFSADQIRERVRVTCDNIDAVNPGFPGELGFGRINATQALQKQTPAIRIDQIVVDTPDGDSIIEPGETVTVHVTVTNFLDAASNVQFALSENTTYTNVPVNSASLATLGTGEQAELEFAVRFSAAAPVNLRVTCTLAISCGSPAYEDKDRFDLRVLPTTVTHDANQVTTTVTSVGKLGFAEVAGGNGDDGLGFLFGDSPNLLFEGAMLLGTGATSLCDAARGSDPSVSEDDFVTTSGGTPILTSQNPLFDQEARASFDDSGAATPLGVRLDQESWQISTPPYDDFLILQYVVHNDGAAPLQNLYVGWFFDWDLDGATYSTNRTGYDASRGLGYVWDTSGSTPTVGVMTLSAPGTVSYRGIWNDEALPENPSWGVYDGFTKAEKWQCLSGGIVNPEAGPADISHSIATGPFDISPGDSVVVAFALLGGTDLADLQANADEAQSAWDAPVDAHPLPASFSWKLEPNVPNPFNPTTSIVFELARPSEVTLDVFSVSGRLVRRILQERRVAGRHQVFWDGTTSSGVLVPSGTYFCRLQAGGVQRTRKMQLLK